MLGLLLLGTSGSFHVAAAMLTAHSLLTARASCTPRAARGSTPQSCTFLPSTEPTTPAVESWSPTQNPGPPSTGAIRAWSHHLAPVLCCSTEHCWGERAAAPPVPCLTPQASAGSASPVFQVVSTWSSPRAGVGTEPDRGEDEGGGQRVNPLHESHAGRAGSLGMALSSCVGLQQCRRGRQGSGLHRGEMNQCGPTKSPWSPWSGCAGQGHCGSWIVSGCHRRMSMDTNPQGQQHRQWQLQGLLPGTTAGLSGTWHRWMVVLSQTQLQPNPQPFLHAQPHIKHVLTLGGLCIQHQDSGSIELISLLCSCGGTITAHGTAAVGPDEPPNHHPPSVRVPSPL